MAVGMLICPDPNGNCSQSSGNDCQMECDAVPCSCPPDAEFTFTAEGPDFQPQPWEIQMMENTCGGPSSFTQLDAVDGDGNPVPPSDCDQVDSNGVVTRTICYKCNSYDPWGGGWGWWASIGPNGETVFIG